MRKLRQERVWRIATVLGVLVVAGYLILAPSGQGTAPLGVGQAKVTAQPSGTIQAQSGTLAPGAGGGETRHTGAIPPPSAAKQAARAAHEEAREAAFRARAAVLPASDPRVGPQVTPPAQTGLARQALDLRGAQAAPPNADGSIAVYRATEIDPPAGFASSIAEPAAAQNGRYVFETWNWFAAASNNGGATFGLVDPETYGPGMADFCCDQDVIFDKGNNRFFWERMGIGDVNGGAGGTNGNRVLFNISPDAFATNLCFYDLRPTLFGLSNAFIDYPRVSLSNNWLYMSMNIFDFTNAPNIGGFVTHVIVRLDLDSMGDCATTPFQFWSFTAGWNPTGVENAREIMYFGDQLITSTGLNDQFRVYWIFDDNNALNFADRTIAPYLFTQGNAVCTVPGGVNPCARSDHRIIGAVLEHNTPLPGNLGAAGDKIDFYWNVRAGNGFPVPYTESAGFFGNTIAYVQRKLLWNNTETFFYAAVGANDREHVGLSAWWFSPSQTPRMVFGIDDDFNANPPGWELWQLGTLTSDANWVNSSSGDYLRARMHAPNGTGWILTGSNRDAAGGEYRPTYSVWGRGRDFNGFVRFDQQ